jgi:hypothetical protein
MRAREYSITHVLLATADWRHYSFEQYEEGDAAAHYGLPAEDVHGVHFPDFEYTAV